MVGRFRLGVWLGGTPGLYAAPSGRLSNYLGVIMQLYKASTVTTPYKSFDKVNSHCRLSLSYVLFWGLFRDTNPSGLFLLFLGGLEFSSLEIPSLGVKH